MSISTTPRRAPAPEAAAPLSPPAERRRRRHWRDPRLFVGVLIVLASVLLGARLLGGADDTVSVYRVRDDLAAGQRVTAADLSPAPVHFGSAEDADSYLAAADPLAEDAVALRAVGAGELLPRAAVGAAGSATLTEVPLAVADDAVPATVAEGAVVDVWVTPADGGGKAVLVLDDVPVLAAPVAATTLGPEGTRQVVVGVDETSARLAPALARIGAGTVVVTRQAAPRVDR